MRLPVVVAVLLAAAVALAGCDGAATAGHGGTATAVGATVPRLSGAQLHYGMTPHLDRSIRLQPDVVVIGGGADAVRSVSGNGLVWTLRRAAPGVDRLAVGKIMFATSLGAGRVLGLHEQGADEEVVLGPVGLTDVVRDAHLASSQPLPMTGIEGYTTAPAAPTPNQDPAIPDTARRRSLTLARTDIIAGPVRASAPAPPAPPLGNLPFPAPDPGQLADGQFHLRPSCCANGLGIHVGYANGGIALLLDLRLQLDRPRITFLLDISGGHLNEASLELTGGAGISVSISMASGRDRDGNIPWSRIRVPVDFTLPIVVLGFPLLAKLSQTFTVATVFLDRASTFNARGDFAFRGALGFGVHGGQVTAYAPTELQSRTPFVASIDGVTLSDVGIRLGYAAVFSIGVGVPGFSAGAWFKLALGIAALKGSPASIEPNCKAASLTLEDAYGFGYQIPRLVASVVNFFLRLVHARPIAASDGWTRGPFELVHKEAPEGGVHSCLR